MGAVISRAGIDKEDGKMEERKNAALKAAMDQISKDFGKGSIMRLGDKNFSIDVEAATTGILGLDIALGVGGLPRGRIIEVFGPESGGKTTLCLHAIAAIQKSGGTAAFIDAEHALDPAYAAKLGIQLESLLVSQPGTGEEALEITDALVRSGAVDIVVIDSVAALVPKAEIEGDMGDQHMGLQARLMSQALRKLTASISRSKTICVFINQLREKIGIMFGNPETTPGGRALKFYSSIRIDVRGGETIKNGTEIIGRKMKVKVVKNKVAPPFKNTLLDVIYGEGISSEGSLIDLGIEHKILETRGTWIRWNEEGLGQGREKAKEWLTLNLDKRKELEDAIRMVTLQKNSVDTEDKSVSKTAVITKLEAVNE